MNDTAKPEKDRRGGDGKNYGDDESPYVHFYLIEAVQKQVDYILLTCTHNFTIFMRITGHFKNHGAVGYT
jgi:hypothetical protein